MLQLDVLTEEKVKSKRNLKHQILGSIPENESVHHTSTSLHQHLFILPAGVCRCESRRRCVDLKLPSYLSSRAQISYHIEDGPCTHKHADPAMVLMQNSMFIRKIFNKHFIFFFLQRNCTSVKVLQNAAESWGVKSSLQVFTECFTDQTTTRRSVSQHCKPGSTFEPFTWGYRWICLLAVRWGKWQQPSWIKVCWLLAGDPRWQLYHTHIHILDILDICSPPAPPWPTKEKKRKEKNTVHQLSILML